MDQFFEDLKKTLTKTAGKVARASGKAVEVSKHYIAIAGAKNDITESYEKIGEMIYKGYKNNESPSDGIQALCEGIDIKLEEIEKVRVGMLESAHESAMQKSKQILIDARNEAASIKEQALADIQMEHERAQDEIKQCIIETATAMAEKLIATKIDEETQSRLFDETIVKLEETMWKN